MPKIGIFYGSTDGNTMHVAERIKEKLDPVLARQGVEEAELLDVADYYLGDMLEFDFLILGVPTWNVGQLQRDWEAVLPEFDEIDLRGKKVACLAWVTRSAIRTPSPTPCSSWPSVPAAPAPSSWAPGRWRAMTSETRGPSKTAGSWGWYWTSTTSQS